MNSLERAATVLNHGVPDRIPVALHNLLMACRVAGANSKAALRHGELLAEAELCAWREFDHDVTRYENGAGAGAEALGCAIDYRDPDPGQGHGGRAFAMRARRTSAGWRRSPRAAGGTISMSVLRTDYKARRV